MQGMINAMNAIANPVVRNLVRSGRNADWPYFDGTFRDYPEFKRKFESFQMNYHRAHRRGNSYNNSATCVC